MKIFTKHQYLKTLRGPVIRSIIRALKLDPGSRGLDVGCGNGDHTLMLAESIQPEGHVTGLDISSDQIALANAAAEKTDLAKQVSFKEGDMRKLPFCDDSFDWAWSMDCMGYAPIEPIPLIRELMRVIRPGGKIAILAWSSQQLLPGYPALEARISATSAGIAPFPTDEKPSNHFSRALGWFRDIGVTNCKVQTFAGCAHAPLEPDVQAELLALFNMRWPNIESELTKDDWVEFQRLCLPDSDDFILKHPDYSAFFTYTMFTGMIPN